MSGMIDVSVANLITGMQFGKVSTPFAVVHPIDKSKPLQALSAGPKFPEAARNYIMKAFDADPAGFVGDDARCRIPEGIANIFHDWLNAQFYLDSDTALIDQDPYPELKERLTGQYWNDVIPPLFKFEFTKIKLRPGSQPFFIRQPPPLEGEVQGGRGAKARFFLQLYMLIDDASVYNRLRACSAIVPLNEFVVKSTQGGRCQGRYGNRLLANNIGVEDYQPELV